MCAFGWHTKGMCRWVAGGKACVWLGMLAAAAGAAMLSLLGQARGGEAGRGARRARGRAVPLYLQQQREVVGLAGMVCVIQQPGELQSGQFGLCIVFNQKMQLVKPKYLGSKRPASHQAGIRWVQALLPPGLLQG